MIYQKDNIISNQQGQQYYRQLIYPEIPISPDDVYVITSEGDRLDLLSYEFYKDASYWWVISHANKNILKGSMFPKPGSQIRIPVRLSDILNDIKKNSQR